ncbi:MAG: hypothetical protein JJ979_02765 [Roseibium sp.]|nr:hypothetical protein [Roseibium sp.]
MKLAEFWAETPSEITDWIRIVSKHTAERDITRAWQNANLTKIGFHSPKKFPNLDQLLSQQPKKKSQKTLYAEAKLAELMALPIDEAKVPAWAREKQKR